MCLNISMPYVSMCVCVCTLCPYVCLYISVPIVLSLNTDAIQHARSSPLPPASTLPIPRTQFSSRRGMTPKSTEFSSRSPAHDENAKAAILDLNRQIQELQSDVRLKDRELERLTAHTSDLSRKLAGALSCARVCLLLCRCVCVHVCV